MTDGEQLSFLKRYIKTDSREHLTSNIVVMWQRERPFGARWNAIKWMGWRGGWLNAVRERTIESVWSYAPSIYGSGFNGKAFPRKVIPKQLFLVFICFLWNHCVAGQSEDLWETTIWSLNLWKKNLSLSSGVCLGFMSSVLTLRLREQTSSLTAEKVFPFHSLFMLTAAFFTL